MIQEIIPRLRVLPSFVKFVILLQLIVDIVVVLDVAIVRQIAVFIYLTFVPGLILVKIFKWNRENSCALLIFSVGLSTALLMATGFALDEILPLVGIQEPLSIAPLLIVMNILTILPVFLGYLRDAKIEINVKAIPKRVILFVILPLLGILGAFTVNVWRNATLLLLMILIISIVVSLIVLRERFLPEKFYPYVLLFVTVALLLHTSLITNYIVGWDVHSEYNVFQMTQNTGRWTASFQSWDDRIDKGNAMLSVTILPAIYSEILNVDGTFMFKVIFPLIVSFLAIALFLMYSTQTSKKLAFLAVFFFISNLSFFSADSFAFKQMVAQLFFALLFLVILKEQAGTFKREVLFIIFGFALVVSHYSTSYVFFFLLLFVWLFYKISGRPQNHAQVTLTEILLFFSMAFAWYIYTSGSAPFDSILNTGGHVFSTLTTEFFNPGSRSATVTTALGIGGSAASFLHQIGRIFFYITEFFIVAGFMKLLLRRKDTSFNLQFALLSALSMVILGAAVVLPNLASSFRMERFYQISLLFLAPICVMGGETVLKFTLRRWNKTLGLYLLLLVLILNFLFQTSFIYKSVGDVTYSLPFSISGPGDEKNLFVSDLIVYQQEVLGAEWFVTRTSSKDIYADYFAAFHVLTSYGGLSVSENTVKLMPLNPEGVIGTGSYVYLRRENIVGQTIVAQKPNGVLVPTNMSEYEQISSWLENQTLIYSNGGNEIFKSTEAAGA
jgi:uncharacterized membrane protein